MLSALLYHLATPIRWTAARFALRRCASVGAGVVVRGNVVVRGAGRVLLGHRVVLDAAVAAIELLAGAGAEIKIGDDVRIGSGVSIEARESITVGAGSTLAPFCKLLDNHLHQVHGNRALRPTSNPIVLEENVEVGPRAVLLPGARLGRDCTVGAGTVVSRQVPEGRIIAGAPPRITARPGKGTPPPGGAA